MSLLDWPISIFGQQHFLCAPVGSKHGQKNVGVCPCILSVSCDNRDRINNLKNTVENNLTSYSSVNARFPRRRAVAEVTYYAYNVDCAGV